MILVTIIVPAIQNAIFTTNTKLISQRLRIGASQDTVDANTQTRTMTNNFQVTAYSIAWLGQGQPPFTTSSYTLAPFDHSMFQDPAQTYVIVDTTRYWAEVNCWKPAAAVVNTTSKRISFADGKGCMTKDVFDDDAYWNVEHSRYMAVHIPVNSPGFASNQGTASETNVTSMCPKFPHRFLIIWWVSGSNPDFNGRGQGLALFCDAMYHKQASTARMLLSFDSVLSFNASGPREVLSQVDFNSTHFQRVIIDGQPPDSYTQHQAYQQMILDVDEGNRIQNSRRTRNLNFSVPAFPTESASNIVSWLVTLAPSALDGYLNSTTLADSYGKTYQQLFGLAMGRNFASSSTKPPQDVESEILARAVTLIPGFLYATEALVATTMLLALWLTWHVSRTRLPLIQNPDCLAQVMDLARCPAVQAKFVPYSNSSESDLNNSLGSETFRVSTSLDGRSALSVTGVISTSRPPTTSNRAIASSVAKNVPEVSWAVCGSAIILVTAVTTSIYVLNSLARRNDGIPFTQGKRFYRSACS